MNKNQLRAKSFKASNITIRPKGAPVDILYLKKGNNNQLECEDGTRLRLPSGITRVGGYGIKGTPDKGVMYLVKKKDNKYEWVCASNFQSVKRWSRILLKELDEEQAKINAKTRLENKNEYVIPAAPNNTANVNPQTNPQADFNALTLASQFMILTLNVNGNIQTLKTKFDGKFVEPIDGCSNVKKYLSHLKEKHGSRAINVVKHGFE